MTIDVLPTLAHLIGAPLPGRKIDGLNIWPLLAGEKDAKSPHGPLFFYWLNDLHAVRSGKWKLHLPHPYSSLDTPGKDGKPGKLVQKRIELALFDLDNDPRETRDVAEQNPEVVKQLQALAEQAREDLGDGLTKRPGKGKREPGRVVE
jgi:arylsulfatase A